MSARYRSDVDQSSSTNSKYGSAKTPNHFIKNKRMPVKVVRRGDGGRGKKGRRLRKGKEGRKGVEGDMDVY